MEPQQRQKNNTSNRQSEKKNQFYLKLAHKTLRPSSDQESDSNSPEEIMGVIDIQNIRQTYAHQILNFKKYSDLLVHEKQIYQKKVQKIQEIQNINDKGIDMFYRNNIRGKKYIKNRFSLENIRGQSKISRKEMFKLTQTYRALLNWTAANNFRKDEQMNKQIAQIENEIRSQNEYLKKDPINIYQSGTKGGQILRLQEALQKFKMIHKSEIQKKRLQQYIP